MKPEFFEIATIEPKVVDLTIDHDYPILSVRMPIYKLSLTHDTDYLEIRYKQSKGQVTYTFNLSAQLIERLHDSQAALAALPLMQPDQVPHGFSLGLIDSVFIAVMKLKAFHDRGEWRNYLSKYPQPKP
jgi:hypothetical protein